MRGFRLFQLVSYSQKLLIINLFVVSICFVSFHADSFHRAPCVGQNEGESDTDAIPQQEAFFQHAIGTSAESLSPRTNYRNLAAYEFALPPLDEQHRMAELLMRVEATSQALLDVRAESTTLRKRAPMRSFGQLLEDAAVRRVPSVCAPRWRHPAE